MNNQELQVYSEQTFESIKHINEYGQEYWLARELARVLQYADWRNFENAIFKAMEACKNSGVAVDDHFGEVTTFTKMNSGARRKIGNYVLSRYACYLIVMNGDTSKQIIAIRQEMKRHNTALADAAHNAGVIEPKDYAVFQNYGYMGLYGGLKAQDIKRRKGLKKSQDILDHMGSTELAANLFRATQTEEKLRRDNIQGKKNANQTHYEVGKKVRQTIQELGGTMPEDLPTPEKSIGQIEREQKKLTKKV